PTVRPLLSTFYPPPRRASSSTLFPYTTLFRSRRLVHDQDTRVQGKRFRNFDTLAVAYRQRADFALHVDVVNVERGEDFPRPSIQDRKSTRLNSSHVKISYAVFCLKKQKRQRCC